MSMPRRNNPRPSRTVLQAIRNFQQARGWSGMDMDESSADTTPPSVTGFAATTPSSSLTVAITTFTADADAAAFKITESSTPPLAGAAGWTVSAPTEYTVAAAGLYTLYPWVKDAAGNVSSVYGSPVAVDASTLYNGLVALWKMNEASDGSAPVSRADSKGSNTLTDINTTASATGLLGNAAAFVIADQTSLECNDNTVLSMGDVNFTFLIWVKTGSSVTGTQIILSKYYSAEYQMYIYGTKFEWDFRNTANSAENHLTATTFGNLSANTWYLVECSHDADNDKVYISVNAGTRDNATWTGGVRDSNNKFRIGAGTNSSGDGVSWFGGLVDQTGLWKGRILTEAEIDEYYNSGTGRVLNP